MANEKVGRGALFFSLLLTCFLGKSEGTIRQCGAEAYVDWHKANSYLEYTLINGTFRNFEDAERYCRRLGGGAHLASIVDENEKLGVNKAVGQNVEGLTKVWIGLANFEMATGSLNTNGELRWMDGQSFAGESNWWSWIQGKKPDPSSQNRQCTYIDVTNNYDWGVTDCTDTLSTAICERFEDQCDTYGSDACADGGLCINDMNGAYYCACPDGQQFPDGNRKSCETCQDCSFTVTSGMDNTVTSSSQTVLRFVKINADSAIEDVTGGGSVEFTGGDPCESDMIINVRYVDPHSGQYITCDSMRWSSKENLCGKTKSDFSLKLSEEDACRGLIGGRLDLWAEVPYSGSDNSFRIMNPKMLVETSVVKDVACHKCADAEWRVGLEGLEYHLVQGDQRTFWEAEQHCTLYGEGGHLASLGSEEEKYSIGNAFLEKLGDLTKVWIGLTNIDGDGNVKPDIDGQPAWAWSDGNAYEGEPEDEWWTWDENARNPEIVKKCVYVDTKNDYKWGVADCDSKLPGSMCERNEPVCDSDAKKRCASTQGQCASDINGAYYCVCPNNMHHLASWDLTSCVSCTGDECTYNKEKDSEILRSEAIAADKSVSTIHITGKVTSCNAAALSVYFRDGRSEELVPCFDSTHTELLLDTSDCVDQLLVNMNMKTGNPCAGLVGGHIELWSKGATSVVGPVLEVSTEQSSGLCGATSDVTTKPSGQTKAGSKKGPVVGIAVAIVVLILLGLGVYFGRKLLTRAPTHAYSIQCDTEDDKVELGNEEE
eukprot:m.338375 g.338375  ORF g.338375 m.338375 type:complete len:769 (-) comp18397_c0_seq1:71-2377(-)